MKKSGRGKSSRALYLLRKKYHLGEFAKSKRPSARRRASRRQARVLSTIKKYTRSTSVKGGSNLTYDVDRFPAVAGGSSMHSPGPPLPEKPPRLDDRPADRR